MKNGVISMVMRAPFSAVSNGIIILAGTYGYYVQNVKPFIWKFVWKRDFREIRENNIYTIRTIESRYAQQITQSTMDHWTNPRAIYNKLLLSSFPFRHTFLNEGGKTSSITPVRKVSGPPSGEHACAQLQTNQQFQFSIHSLAFDLFGYHVCLVLGSYRLAIYLIEQSFYSHVHASYKITILKLPSQVYRRVYNKDKDIILDTISAPARCLKSTSQYYVRSPALSDLPWRCCRRENSLSISGRPCRLGSIHWSFCFWRHLLDYWRRRLIRRAQVVLRHRDARRVAWLLPIFWVRPWYTRTGHKRIGITGRQHTRLRLPGVDWQLALTCVTLDTGSAARADDPILNPEVCRQLAPPLANSWRYCCASFTITQYNYLRNLYNAALLRDKTHMIKKRNSL